jgi:hypothetical protein
MDGLHLGGKKYMDQFAITVTKDGGFLRVTIRGPATRTNLLGAVERIIVETKLEDIWRVLVDATGAPATLGAFDKYQIGVEFARVADRRMTMAVVARAEIVDHFFETVARNRGGPVRVFTDETAALHWLLGTASS